MNVLEGTGVAPVVAVGKADILPDAKAKDVAENITSGFAAEEKKLKLAIEKACQQISAIISTAGGEAGEILNSHISFLEDPAFNDQASGKIRQFNWTALKAVQETTTELHEVFLSFEDAYLRERAADIKDVGGRVLSILRGEEDIGLANLPPNTIIVAKELTPSQTAQLNKDNVLGFVTEEGGKTSHTAIMAKAMGIAAVVGCKDATKIIAKGDSLAVNAATGQVFINADEATLAQQKAQQKKCIEHLRKAAKAKNSKLFRTDGTPVLVTANVADKAQALSAKENGADGIGLFRTEFLYMGRQQLPSETEQFLAYKAVAEIFGERQVIIRTLDIGGDKYLPYLQLPKEENPYLGVRAIRLCLKNKDIFSTQLRAILRASAYGNIKIMFPMISCAEELEEAKEVLAQCKQTLETEGTSYNKKIKLGMMIEVPAAAVQADFFAKQVDFFSIGTNDLAQYTLAVDRGNTEVRRLYNPMHPSVLWLIKNTIDAAKQHNISCEMCGELAADEEAINILAEYGLNEFSVGINSVAQTKAALIKLPYIKIQGT